MQRVRHSRINGSCRCQCTTTLKVSVSCGVCLCLCVVRIVDGSQFRLVHCCAAFLSTLHRRARACSLHFAMTALVAGTRCARCFISAPVLVDAIVDWVDCGLCPACNTYLNHHLTQHDVCAVCLYILVHPRTPDVVGPVRFGTRCSASVVFAHPGARNLTTRMCQRCFSDALARPDGIDFVCCNDLCGVIFADDGESVYVNDVQRFLADGALMAANTIALTASSCLGCPGRFG